MFEGILKNLERSITHPKKIADFDAGGLSGDCGRLETSLGKWHFTKIAFLHLTLYSWKIYVTFLFNIRYRRRGRLSGNGMRKVTVRDEKKSQICARVAANIYIFPDSATRWTLL